MGGCGEVDAEWSGRVRRVFGKPPTPVVAPNAVLKIFDPYEVGGALAPGNVVAIYGANFADQTGQPSALPLPVSVAGTSVLIGGIESPLFYVGPGQIDAQVPFELAAGKQYQVIVSANGALSTPVSIQVNSVAPNVLTYPASTEQLVATRPDYSLVSDAAPAKPGEVLVLWLAGMGLSDNPALTSGAASPLNPLANAQSQPTLTIDGKAAQIYPAVLTPGLVGLYQVGFQVPTDAQDGYHQVVLYQSGTAANKTTLPVHH